MSIAQLQLNADGVLVPVRLPKTMDVLIEGEQRPYDDLLEMDEEARNAAGFYTIVPASSPFGLKYISCELVFAEGVVFEDAVYPIVGLNTLKFIKLEQLADLRKEKTKEVTFAGIPIVMDKNTEDAVAKAVLSLELCPEGTEIDFEVSRGFFVPLDLTYLQGLGVASFLRVQACFTHVKNVTALIMACQTQAELEAIDITAGWPA